MLAADPMAGNCPAAEAAEGIWLTADDNPAPLGCAISWWAVAQPASVITVTTAVIDDNDFIICIPRDCFEKSQILVFNYSVFN
jgi:hypothetical protein